MKKLTLIVTSTATLVVSISGAVSVANQGEGSGGDPQVVRRISGPLEFPALGEPAAAGFARHVSGEPPGPPVPIGHLMTVSHPNDTDFTTWVDVRTRGLVPLGSGQVDLSLESVGQTLLGHPGNVSAISFDLQPDLSLTLDYASVEVQEHANGPRGLYRAMVSDGLHTAPVAVKMLEDRISGEVVLGKRILYFAGPVHGPWRYILFANANIVGCGVL